MDAFTSIRYFLRDNGSYSWPTSTGGRSACQKRSPHRNLVGSFAYCFDWQTKSDLGLRIRWPRKGEPSSPIERAPAIMRDDFLRRGIGTATSKYEESSAPGEASRIWYGRPAYSLRRQDVLTSCESYAPSVLSDR